MSEWVINVSSKRHRASCSLTNAKFHKIPTPHTNTAKANFQITNCKETLAPPQKTHKHTFMQPAIVTELKGALS
jgi:hypothetical protein